MGNSESVKSAKSVVQFLWLRLAALGLFAAILFSQPVIFAPVFVVLHVLVAGHFHACAASLSGKAPAQ